MGQNNFENKLNSSYIKYSKRLFDLIAINFIFCVISICSLFVLFFPGLVAIHKIIQNIIDDEEKSVYKTFFKEIKNQWSFSWRISLLSLIVFLSLSILISAAFIYIKNVEYNIIGWFAIVFLIQVAIIFLIILIELMLFNDYFFDDTFFMMVKKASLICLKKKKMVILNFLILIAELTVLYLIPYIIPFVSFSTYIYIIKMINKNTFEGLKREEEKRIIEEENISLINDIKEENL